MHRYIWLIFVICHTKNSPYYKKYHENNKKAFNFVDTINTFAYLCQQNKTIHKWKTRYSTPKNERKEVISDLYVDLGRTSFLQSNNNHCGKEIQVKIEKNRKLTKLRFSRFSLLLSSVVGNGSADSIWQKLVSSRVSSNYRLVRKKNIRAWYDLYMYCIVAGLLFLLYSKKNKGQILHDGTCPLFSLYSIIGLSKS